MKNEVIKDGNEVIKDGLKWAIVVFAAALLIILVATQKDKLIKAVNKVEGVPTVSNVESQDAGSAVVVDEVEGLETDGELPADNVDPATGEEQAQETVETSEEPVRVEGRVDENGVELAP